MATTTYFDETVGDSTGAATDLELGSMTDRGQGHIYLSVGDTTIILDETMGRKLAGDMARLAAYLGYH